MNSARVNFILKNLSSKERDEFLKELLQRELSGKPTRDIILSWEATAEINSRPSSRTKIIARSKKLRQFLLQSKHA